MSKLTYIYQKNVSEIRLLDTLNYTIDEFKKNPQGCFPSWDSINMTASSEKYDYPCIDFKTKELRNKTREEMILEGKIELLQDGEYIENGKIVTVPVPENLLKKIWDKELHIWKEGATIQELKTKYYSIIDKYKQEILETGYTFRGHQQKVREKDKSWLSLRRDALHTSDMLKNKITAEYKLLVDRTQLTKEGWVFDTGEVEFLDIIDLNEMLQQGNDWSSAIFKVEEILKAKTPNILIKKQDFLDEIAKHTSIISFSIK